MTRINANIRPEHLIDQHLVAEYREIVRIPNAVLKLNGNVKRDYPGEFRLGTGHVLFFYDKIKFLHQRFLELKKEMRNRGIANNMDDEMFTAFRDNVDRIHYYRDISASEALRTANLLIVERIIDRIGTMKRPPTLNGKPIEVSEYGEMLRAYYSSAQSFL